jgi:hypothetical protein
LKDHKLLVLVVMVLHHRLTELHFHLKVLVVHPLAETLLVLVLLDMKVITVQLVVLILMIMIPLLWPLMKQI